MGGGGQTVSTHLQHLIQLRFNTVETGGGGGGGWVVGTHHQHLIEQSFTRGLVIQSQVTVTVVTMDANMDTSLRDRLVQTANGFEAVFPGLNHKFATSENRFVFFPSLLHRSCT